VLQDQVYGFEEGLNYTDEACEDDSERCAAVLSLLEGDASLTEILWFEKHASLVDYRDLMDAYEDYQSDVLDSAPGYISADLYFPYEQGLAFVQSLYDQGGYDAVDEAYQDLPLSTEQILHPERYPDDIPQQVTLPDLSSTMGKDWQLFDQNIMGEWFTYLILGKGFVEGNRLPEAEAKTAAEGWGGDAYAFYMEEGSDQVAFILDTIWDTSMDADEFEDAFYQYADLRWGEPGLSIMGFPAWETAHETSVFFREGNRTIWVIAPTELLVEAILAEAR